MSVISTCQSIGALAALSGSQAVAVGGTTDCCNRCCRQISRVAVKVEDSRSRQKHEEEVRDAAHGNEQRNPPHHLFASETCS
ncbi:hypothetical protein C0Q70_09571 [Pomacea canaliculata]|uniref:Secreted protein n=1 Tax=Pomacea canaliculata TaxID=400727 RepID=A0A2T7PA65_POMCA|nr:hypothetical protein C0Q70_09571 [Pomacea canaliculata]